jgi:hypothetical protein
MTEPEHILWMSVLTQALQDLSGPDFVAKPARAWLASRSNSLGSLIWTCDQLGLDPDAVRQNVLRRPLSQLSGLLKNRSRAAEQAA